MKWPFRVAVFLPIAVAGSVTRPLTKWGVKCPVPADARPVGVADDDAVVVFGLPQHFTREVGADVGGRGDRGRLVAGLRLAVAGVGPELEVAVGDVPAPGRVDMTVDGGVAGLAPGFGVGDDDSREDLDFAFVGDVDDAARFVDGDPVDGADRGGEGLERRAAFVVGDDFVRVGDVERVGAGVDRQSLGGSGSDQGRGRVAVARLELVGPAAVEGDEEVVVGAIDGDVAEDPAAETSIEPSGAPDGLNFFTARAP